jgi:hypothetical protein
VAHSAVCAAIAADGRSTIHSAIDHRGRTSIRKIDEVAACCDRAPPAGVPSGVVDQFLMAEIEDDQMPRLAASARSGWLFLGDQRTGRVTAIDDAAGPLSHRVQD